MSIFDFLSAATQSAENLKRKRPSGGPRKVVNHDAIEMTNKGTITIGKNLVSRFRINDENGFDFSISALDAFLMAPNNKAEDFDRSNEVAIVVTPMDSSPNPILGSRKSLTTRVTDEEGNVSIENITLEQAIENGKPFKFTNLKLVEYIMSVYGIGENVRSFEITIKEDSESRGVVYVKMPGFKNEVQIRRDVLGYDIVVDNFKVVETNEDVVPEGTTQETSNVSDDTTEVDANGEAGNESDSTSDIDAAAQAAADMEEESEGESASDSNGLPW